MNDNISAHFCCVRSSLIVPSTKGMMMKNDILLVIIYYIEWNSILQGGRNKGITPLPPEAILSEIFFFINLLFLFTHFFWHVCGVHVWWAVNFKQFFNLFKMLQEIDYKKLSKKIHCILAVIIISQLYLELFSWEIQECYFNASVYTVITLYFIKQQFNVHWHVYYKKQWCKKKKFTQK